MKLGFDGLGPVGVQLLILGRSLEFVDILEEAENNLDSRLELAKLDTIAHVEVENIDLIKAKHIDLVGVEHTVILAMAEHIVIVVVVDTMVDQRDTILLAGNIGAREWRLFDLHPLVPRSKLGWLLLAKKEYLQIFHQFPMAQHV